MADNSNLIVDALQKTDPALAQAIDADNSWKAAIKKRGARVKLYRQYERGEHKATITKQMRNILRLVEDDTGLTDYNVNYMRIIVDKLASRLHVSNIAAGDDAKEWMLETIERNSFDAQQGTWIRSAIRDGDSYVMVDPATLRWVYEPAYDGFSGMVVLYDGKTRQATWACKLWSESDTSDIDDESDITINLVVYQIGSISYWRGSEGGAQVEPSRIDPEVDAVPSIEGNTELLKFDMLPFVSFHNRLDGYTHNGESALRPAIPPQNLMNRVMHDQATASSFSAYKLLWSIGFEIDVGGVTPGGVVNLTLKKDGVTITDFSPEQVEFIKAAKVGQFEASDISQYTNQLDRLVQHISQITETPIYGVTVSGVLSGEAMQQLESGLVGNAIRFQHQNTDSFKELIRLTSEIQNAYETELGGTAPQIDMVKIIWKSPKIINIKDEVAALKEVNSGLPGKMSDEWYIRQLGAIYNMSTAEVDEEIENAKSQQGLLFETLTGGGGAIPVA